MVTHGGQFGSGSSSTIQRISQKSPTQGASFSWLLKSDFRLPWQANDNWCATALPFLPFCLIFSPSQELDESRRPGDISRHEDESLFPFPTLGMPWNGSAWTSAFFAARESSSSGGWSVESTDQNFPSLEGGEEGSDPFFTSFLGEQEQQLRIPSLAQNPVFQLVIDMRISSFPPPPSDRRTTSWEKSKAEQRVDEAEAISCQNEAPFTLLWGPIPSAEEGFELPTPPASWEGKNQLISRCNSRRTGMGSFRSDYSSSSLPAGVNRFNLLRRELLYRLGGDLSDNARRLSGKGLQHGTTAGVEVSTSSACPLHCGACTVRRVPEGERGGCEPFKRPTTCALPFAGGVGSEGCFATGTTAGGYGNRWAESRSRSSTPAPQRVFFDRKAREETTSSGLLDNDGNDPLGLECEDYLLFLQRLAYWRVAAALVSDEYEDKEKKEDVGEERHTDDCCYSCEKGRRSRRNGRGKTGDWQKLLRQAALHKQSHSTSVTERSNRWALLLSSFQPQNRPTFVYDCSRLTSRMSLHHVILSFAPLTVRLDFNLLTSVIEPIFQSIRNTSQASALHLRVSQAAATSRQRNLGVVCWRLLNSLPSHATATGSSWPEKATNYHWSLSFPLRPLEPLQFESQLLPVAVWRNRLLIQMIRERWGGLGGERLTPAHSLHHFHHHHQAATAESLAAASSRLLVQSLCPRERTFLRSFHGDLCRVRGWLLTPSHQELTAGPQIAIGILWVKEIEICLSVNRFLKVRQEEEKEEGI